MECRAEKRGGTSEELVGLSENWGGMVGNGVGDGIIGGEPIGEWGGIGGKGTGRKGE
jgi:hypothetical protein